MPARTKRVNVTTVVAVRTTNPPICGTLKNIEMTTGDILKCLCKRAFVEEILPDGSTVRLNMKNYYTDNTPVVAAAAPVSVKPEPKVEKNDVEAVLEKGGDTDESVQEEPVIYAIADVATKTSEDPVVETVQESAEETVEGNGSMPECEAPEAEVAGGSIEATVEEEVVTMIVTEDKVEITEESTACDDIAIAEETVLGSPVDEIPEEAKTSSSTPKTNNTPKKKKK